jgi:toxin CptA
LRDSSKYSGEGPGNDPAWRVVIPLGPSRRAGAWITAVTAAALVAILAAGIPGLAKAVLACAMVGAAVRAARLHAGQEGPGAVRRITVDLAGGVVAEYADGRIATGALAEGSFVAPWLTVVRWVPEGARFSRAITIVPDAVEAGAFRRLRILLRWR